MVLSQTQPVQSNKLQTSAVVFFLAFFLGSLAVGQSLPVAPSHSKAFWTASLTGGAVTFLDSYGTSLIRSHAIAVEHRGGYQNCVAEGTEPFLYGKEPSTARAFGVGAAKVVATEVVAGWLYKHHHRFWLTPFSYEFSTLSGVVKNLEDCR